MLLFIKTPPPTSNPTDPPIAVAQAQAAPLTSSPTPYPTSKPTVPITSYPITAQPTEPTDNRALNLITGDECIVASGKSQKSGSSSKSGSGSSKSGSSSRSRRRGLISQTRRRFLSSNSSSGSSKSGSGSSKSGSSTKSTKSCKPKASLTWKKKDHAWKVRRRISSSKCISHLLKISYLMLTYLILISLGGYEVTARLQVTTRSSSNQRSWANVCRRSKSQYVN